MFENPRRGRQARNSTANVPKILDLKSSSEHVFSENCRWLPLIWEIIALVIKKLLREIGYSRSKSRSEVHSFFFIRTSNFDAEAERSYIFWRFEAETFLKMFLNLPGIVFQPISADVTRQTIKEQRANFFGTL